MQANRRIVLAERPRYVIPTANCFRCESAATPEPREGELLLHTLWLGMEPYLQGRVKQASARAQAAPVKLGEPMVGPAVGRVEISRHPDYQRGDLVYGLWSWQDYAVSDTSHVRKVPAELPRISYALGALGYSGFGAYLALVDLGRAEAGETLVVGAATGGLGQIAGQIARLKGVRAVGVAGGPEKCRIATEQLGFEACIDRRLHKIPEQLHSACAQGIDVYLETVGGHVFDAALPLLNVRARMVVCGLMEMYSASSLPDGPDRTMLLLNEINLKRLEVRGLVVFDHMKRRYSEFKKEMLGWLNNGHVKPLESVVEGLEQAPAALQGVFEGRNIGKTVVWVAD